MSDHAVTAGEGRVTLRLFLGEPCEMAAKFSPDIAETLGKLLVEQARAATDVPEGDCDYCGYTGVRRGLCGQWRCAYCDRTRQEARDDSDDSDEEWEWQHE